VTYQSFIKIRSYNFLGGRKRQDGKIITENKQLSEKIQMHSFRRKKSEILNTLVMRAYLNGRIYMSRILFKKNGIIGKVSRFLRKNWNSFWK